VIFARAEEQAELATSLLAPRLLEHDLSIGGRGENHKAGGFYRLRGGREDLATHLVGRGIEGRELGGSGRGFDLNIGKSHVLCNINQGVVVVVASAVVEW
jgi:hypothetical protein